MTFDELFPRLRAMYFIWVAAVPTLILTAWWVGGRGKKWAHHAAMGVVLALAALNIVAYFPFTNDDTFIFLRYADNLIHGLGPVYNAGERCEGFTSPLWLAMISGAQWAGVNPLLFAKFLGGLLTLALIIFTYRLCRQATGDPRFALLGAIIMAVSQNLASWASAGMDTTLFLCWETALLWHVSRTGKPDWPTAALTAVGFVIRPEAYLVAVIIWTWLTALAAPMAGMRGRIARFGLIILIGLVVLAARWWYFDDFLPNTYYAKSDRSLRAGFGYILNLLDYWGVMVCGLAMAGLWLSRARLAPMTAIAAGWIVYFFCVGGDVLELRLALFLFPCVVVGFVAGVGFLMSTALLPPRVIILGIALLFAGQSYFQMYDVLRNRTSARGHLYVPNNSIHTFEADLDAARYVSTRARPTDLLATDNIGIVGYYNIRLRILDTYGLASRAMARLIRARQPQAIDSLLAASRPQWILCSPNLIDDRERWSSGGIGYLGNWVYEQYDVEQHFPSRTGYARVLLRRRAAD